MHLFFGEFMKNDEKYMKLALEEAKKAFALGEVPVGAVIVCHDTVIACAHNQKEFQKSVLKHAELLAIAEASKFRRNWRLEDCELYVTLEPCPMCASAIQQARLYRVIYGTDSNNVENHAIVDKIFKTVNANRPVSVTSGVLADECSEILSLFFKNRR